MVRFLAPFDPVVWDRRRFEHLWGWAYRFEAYTPPAKARTCGYYALPLLWRDDVIGWANVLRKGGELTTDIGFVSARLASGGLNRSLKPKSGEWAPFLGGWKTADNLELRSDSRRPGIIRIMNQTANASSGIFAMYRRVPLYLKILVAMLLGVGVGLLVNQTWAVRLNQPAVIILRLLGAIAPPLILVAVIRALMTANVRGRLAGKLFFLLVLNTLVAILVGLTVANIIRPGKHAAARATRSAQGHHRRSAQPVPR